MRVVFLLLVGIACVVSVTEEDCSTGDLDYLCEHVVDCAAFISQAEDTLCRTISKDIGTTPPFGTYASTADNRGRVTGTERITRGRVTGPVTNNEVNPSRESGQVVTQFVTDVTANIARRQNTQYVTVADTLVTNKVTLVRGERITAKYTEKVTEFTERRVLTDRETFPARTVTVGYTAEEEPQGRWEGDGPAPELESVWYSVKLGLDPTEGPTVEWLMVKPTIDSFRTVRSDSEELIVQTYANVRFECRATGAPTPSVSILKVTKNADLDNKAKKTPQEQSTFKEQQSEVMSSSFVILELQAVDDSNAGLYRCMACNYWGCVEEEIELTVRDLCKDVQCEGGKICVADSELNKAVCLCPDNCAEENESVPDIGCSNYCTSYFSTCQMKNDACEAGRSDTEYIVGKGLCALNDENSLEKSVSLLYNGASAPTSVTVQAGDSLTLECSYQYTSPPDTSGVQPSVTYKWFKVVNGKSKIVGTESTLTMGSLRTRDKGTYHCKVTHCMQYKTRSNSIVIEMESNVKDYRTDSCYIYGDPHFITFDNTEYNFMGQCDYVLAMDCEAASWFVYGRMRPCTGPFQAATCLESVTLYHNSDVIELMRGWLINHFGNKIMPKNYPNTNLQIGETFNVRFNGRYVSVEILLSTYQDEEGNTVSKKVRVIWDGFVGVEVQAPYDTRTCGLCGNNDGVSDDNDFTPSGRMELGGGSKENVFGDSWRVDKYGLCPATPEKVSNEDACGTGYAAAKEECEAVFGIPAFAQCSFDTASYISSCIYDTCAGLAIERTDNFSPACITALAYAKACENQRETLHSNDQYDDLAGTSVAGWEDEASCPSQKERFSEILSSGCPQLNKEDDQTTATFILE